MSPRIGDALVHPGSLLALAILGLNDHVAKGRLPGWLTGKLSDVAGMVFFPLVLWALVELAARLLSPKSVGRRRAHLIGSVVATGVVFAAVNLSETAGLAYAWAIAALQWPVRALIAWRALPLEPAAHVVDPSDLIALPALVLAYLIGRRYLS